MSKTTKWIIGIVVVLVVLQFAMPFLWQLFYPAANGYGYGVPMMRGPMTLAPGASAGVGAYGHMGFGFLGGLFMWLLGAGTLILIALGIAYLWKKLTEKPAQP